MAMLAKAGQSVLLTQAIPWLARLRMTRFGIDPVDDLENW